MICFVGEVTDPGWFLSSLSQVTAAIVGLIGGFILLRVAAILARWRNLANQLDLIQHAYWSKRRESSRSKEGVGTSPSAVLAEKDRLWDELLRLVQDRDAARIPRELAVAAVGITLLTAIGVVWPLMELDVPSTGRQLGFVIPWTIVLGGTAFTVVLEARLALKKLRRTRLLDPIQAEYDSYMLQFDDWKRHDGSGDSPESAG